jgi:SAM-dependent methyltransferase
MELEIKCPICNDFCKPLDVVDFNKSCEEQRGIYLPLSGIPIYYYFCDTCKFCFAPEFHHWSLADFEEKIYNDNYATVDPDYLSLRPTNNAEVLVELFGSQKDQIMHLDYGGGNGLLSKLLRGEGWNSASYDPFVDHGMNLNGLGKFNLITAFEVFEHVPDVKSLMKNLSSLMDENGIVLFTTLLSNNKIISKKRITWWYASPRNGHISIFSNASLRHLAKQAGLSFHSFSDGFHAFCKTIPPWANHLINP